MNSSHIKNRLHRIYDLYIKLLQRYESRMNGSDYALDRLSPMHAEDALIKDISEGLSLLDKDFPYWKREYADCAEINDIKNEIERTILSIMTTQSMYTSCISQRLCSLKYELSAIKKSHTAVRSYSAHHKCD